MLLPNDAGVSRRSAPIRDGSPDVFTLSDAEVNDGPTNLGTLSLSEAFLVDVIVEDPDGNPVEGAQFRVVSFGDDGRSGFGTGSQRTNAEGRLQYADAPSPARSWREQSRSRPRRRTPTDSRRRIRA